MSTIEALYIFDEHNTPLLEHTYTSRPPTSSTLLPLYLSHPSPRPPLIYLPSTNPSTLLYALTQDTLLFLCPVSVDTPSASPLSVLEFLHRVADALEDFLGAPLIASKIEANYDVVAQVLGEMVDGGVIACTEPNALREVVEAPSLLKGLLGQVGLPSATPTLGSGGGSGSGTFGGLGMGRGNSPRLSPMMGGIGSSASGAGNGAQAASPVPWRKANVRHTSNELYVDMVETVSITLSPSGRPLSAIANGSVAFTAKVSGIPDLNLVLGCPGGGGIANTVSLPVFHPCVRLNKWKERPGELSFVPPDGRFVLMGYEVDLLGSAALDAFSTSSTKGKINPKLNVPATVSVRTALGPTASDFEVRLQLNPRFSGKSSSSSTSSSSSSFSNRGGLAAARLGASSFTSSSSAIGTTAAPAIDEMVIHIPLPAGVKNVVDLRAARGAGEAVYAPGDREVEWRISSRAVANLMAGERGGGLGVTTTLRGTIIGQDSDAGDDVDGSGGPVLSSNTYDYEDEDGNSSYQATLPPPITNTNPNSAASEDVKRKMKVLMPSCATVSFSVKGWLPSGIKVESLGLDQKRSKGLGSGVTPYKGVKYLGVSRKGVECRC